MHRIGARAVNASFRSGPERIIGIELCWDWRGRMRMDAARILREMEWEQLLRAATLTLGH